MSDSLRARIAQAIAARYTSEYKYVPSTERRGRSEPVPATLTDRAEQSPFVVFDDTDGGRSMRVPTCTEIAERVVEALNAHAADTTLVAALHAELADIHGVAPGHSLTGDYAALKPDAERLARVRDEHTAELENEITRLRNDLETATSVEVWPLARVLTEVRCDSQDWSWEEEWADLDQRHAATGYLDKLDQQIQANGITMPVLIGNDGRLWDGHHRLRIAVRRSIPYVPVEVVPRKPQET